MADHWPQIEIGNSRSRVTGLSDPVFKLLRHELSYLSGEPGARRHLQPDGSVKVSYWDGFRRLLDRKGVMPSGLVPRACRLLRKWNVGVQLIDRRQRPQDALPLWTMPKDFQLRDYQKQACDEAQRLSRGVIDSPPRTGKTVMMAELARRVACKTVITSPTEAIAQQTYAKLLELFAPNDWSGMVADCGHDFYLLTGGPPKTRKERNAAKRATVFVATAPTAANMPQPWWDEIECLIVDERHHQAASTYHQINDKAINAYWRWGFTGTDFRSNPGEQVALEACLGRTVTRFRIPQMIERNVLVRGRVEFLPIDRSASSGIWAAKFAPAYQRGIVECNLRNQAVVYAATHYQQQGRKVLVLVQRIEHGERLEQLIQGSRFVKGADGEQVREAVAQLDSGKLRCLIGSPVVGEGLDCPSADCLIYAKGFKARVTHTQDTFRVLTNDGRKSEALIVDFADRHSKTLLDHSVERMRNYQAMGMHCQIADGLPLDLQQLTLY